MVDFKSMFRNKTNEESKNEETIFSAKFDKDKQIVSALNMVGAGFEAKGGSSLMLTEAVENGVDAIIKFNEKRKSPIQGEIRVIIDQVHERILIIDNGTGFIQIKHICEKPFDSLKEMDTSQTGKFARGLHGFRAFCKNLSYITERLPDDIPPNESDTIKSSSTKEAARLDFEWNTNNVKVRYVENSEFAKYSNFEHGTIAIYENWNPGQFEKLNISGLIRRLQHHFGELIRSGNISIVVELRPGKIAGIGPVQLKFQEVEPRDYSTVTPLNIEAIKYVHGKIEGVINFELYLSDRGKTDRWNAPYLLYKGRPVGDGFICEIDEFTEHPIWKHKFLTGYITCDFCEINELRQGLKINEERDFLFNTLLGLEKFLEAKVKEHSKGLYELKLQKQVNELVKDLQLFFKEKNIFNFKIARSTGFLSKENDEIEVIELANAQGPNPSLEVKSEIGDGSLITSVDKFQEVEVKQDEHGTEKTLNPEIGVHGNGSAQEKVGSAGVNAKKNDLDSNSETQKGFENSDNGTSKPFEESSPHETGGKEKQKKKGNRHKPRGFGMVFQDDEFNDDLSWFDDVNSVVIINSQHPRYLSRAQDESQFKSLMSYLAELYIWEITKLIYAKDEEISKIMKFLDFKFEYSENMRRDEKEGRYLNEPESAE